MKNLSLLVWLTQLGLSVVSPLVGFLLLAVWLHNSCGWGNWVIWVGIGFGVLCGFEGLRVSLKAMSSLVQDDSEQEQPPVSFNDHE